jgi:hypothetical protein
VLLDLRVKSGAESVVCAAVEERMRTVVVTPMICMPCPTVASSFGPSRLHQIKSRRSSKTSRLRESQFERPTLKVSPCPPWDSPGDQRRDERETSFQQEPYRQRSRVRRQRPESSPERLIYLLLLFLLVIIVLFRISTSTSTSMLMLMMVVLEERGDLVRIRPSSQRDG